MNSAKAVTQQLGWTELVERQADQVCEVRARWSQILVEWGMPTNGCHYKRLFDAFRRVSGSTMFFGTANDRKGLQVWQCSPVHFFDSMKLRLTETGAKTGARDNSVTPSPEFWRELQQHPTPVEAEVVRLLARNPGCLDLYTWLTWRCYQAKGRSECLCLDRMVLRISSACRRSPRAQIPRANQELAQASSALLA